MVKPHRYFVSEKKAMKMRLCKRGADGERTAEGPPGESWVQGQGRWEATAQGLRDVEEEHREPRFQNYVPEDRDLKRWQVPQAKPVALEEKVKKQLEAAKPEPVIEEVDLANLAPRKLDWDLKRDVANKLEKLEKWTQKAISELIHERLKGH
uniref:coiled-coil domain-containing protein 12-like n=1 Tax=Arvicanthis niloticus TaxID=61156 RepID=UPI0014874441|nr:coiled-coil domain-containing protein 12-like [Arvicanthis niloticus]